MKNIMAKFCNDIHSYPRYRATDDAGVMLLGVIARQVCIF